MMKRCRLCVVGLMTLALLVLSSRGDAFHQETGTMDTPDSVRRLDGTRIVGPDGTTIDLADLLQVTVAAIWEESEAYTLSERRMRLIHLIAFTVGSFADDAAALLERAAHGFSEETLPLVTATSVLVAGRKASAIAQGIERTAPVDQRDVVRFAAAYPDRILTRPEIRSLQGSPESQLLTPAQVGAPLPTTPEGNFARAALTAATSQPPTSSPDPAPTPAPPYDSQ